MNRRQKRTLAKLIPGYRKLLKEAKEKSIKQFEEMMQKRWTEQELADGYIPADAAFSNEEFKNMIQKQQEDSSEKPKNTGDINNEIDRNNQSGK